MQACGNQKLVQLKLLRYAKEIQPFSWLINFNPTREISGTLAPPMLGANDTMDVVFATHWIYPSRSPVLQPVDKKCVETALDQRTGNHSIL
jgi:hypothetical protein